jgi:hypothetical protein
MQSNNKNWLRGTGGDPACNVQQDPVLEGVLRIIDKSTVVGLENIQDV